MSHYNTGPIANYNSLYDRNLASYFGNERVRKHLIKAGLITKEGEIVSEETYRLKNNKKQHRQMIKELLADAIVKRTLEVEKHRQHIIKRELEKIAKKEMVKRVKATKGRHGDEDILPLLLPNTHDSHHKSEPGALDRPSAGAEHGAMSVRHAYCYDDEDGQAPSDLQDDQLRGDDRDFHVVKPRKASDPAFPRERIETMHLTQLDQIAMGEYNGQVEKVDRKPAKPPYSGYSKNPPKSGSGRAGGKSASSAQKNKAFQRTLRLAGKEQAKYRQARVQSMCEVRMQYLGLPINTANNNTAGSDGKNEVTIEQQHCGGNTILVFKHRLAPQDKFTFVSRRHRNFPFSVTIYIDGVVDCRVSACCEYKHRSGCRLGGANGHFRFVDVHGSAPCYKCQLEDALNLTSRPARNERCGGKSASGYRGSLNAKKRASKKTLDAEENNNNANNSINDGQKTGVIIRLHDQSEASESEVDRDADKDERAARIATEKPRRSLFSRIARRIGGGDSSSSDSSDEDKEGPPQQRRAQSAVEDRRHR